MDALLTFTAPLSATHGSIADWSHVQKGLLGQTSATAAPAKTNHKISLRVEEVEGEIPQNISIVAEENERGTLCMHVDVNAKCFPD